MVRGIYTKACKVPDTERNNTMLQVLERTNYRLVSIEKLTEITRIQKNKPVAFSLDLETTGLNPLTGRIVTLQFGTVKNAFILDCRYYYTLSDQDKELWTSIIREMLTSCPLIVGHNLKFDWKWLKHHFNVSLDKVADTMLQELIIYGVGMGKAENMGISVNMEETGERYNLPVSKELQKWSVDLDKRPEWNEPFPEDFLAYCGQDVCIPLLIHSAQMQRLEALELQPVADIENKCLPAIAQMELDGCYVDIERWKRILEQKAETRAALEKELQAELTPYIAEEWDRQYRYESYLLEEWTKAKEMLLSELAKRYPEVQGKCTWSKFKTEGVKLWREKNPRPKTPKKPEGVINLGSHDQLKKALAGMGIEVDSTDRGHLEEYKYQFSMIGKLLEWKHLDKFINAFGYGLLAKIDIDQRIHPTYNQIGAATGRMSCSNPNWQQLPSHEPEETSVRRCVIAAPGNVLLTADFSNIEARILADVSEDPALLEFFKQGGDLHCTTARLMFGLTATDKELKGNEKQGVKPLELRPGLSYRSIAKTINFGLVYGMSPIKLGRTLGISTEEATELFNRYFEAYPGVANWLQCTPQVSLERGYSLTLAGRKRFYLSGKSEPVYDRNRMTREDYMLLKANWFKVRGGQERQAKNAPIQGSNADITKVALILLYHKMPPYVKLVACVHDEIVLECPEEKAEAVKKLLATAMHKACTKYLKRVHIPPIDVSIDSYWKKD